MVIIYLQQQRMREKKRKMNMTLVKKRSMYSRIVFSIRSTTATTTAPPPTTTKTTSIKKKKNENASNLYVQTIGLWHVGDFVICDALPFIYIYVKYENMGKKAYRPNTHVQ